MKAIVKQLAAFSVVILSLASCQRAELDMQGPEPSGPQKELREVIITAQAEDPAPLTRSETEVEQSGGTKSFPMYWLPGDKMMVYSAGDASEFTSINTTRARVAKFKGFISVISGADDGTEKDYVWAIYPSSAAVGYSEPDGNSATAVITADFPEVQESKAGSYADDIAMTIGRSESLGVYFKSVYSCLYFTFARNDIASITLKGRNNETLAGRINVTLVDNEPVATPVAGYESKAVTMYAQDGTFVPGQEYYMLFLPQTFSQGISLTVRRTDGQEGTYELRNQNLKLGRNVFTRLATPDSRVESPANIESGISTGWVQSTSSPINEIWYKSVDNVEVPYAEGQTATLNQLVANIPPSAENDNWGILRFAAPVTETDRRSFSGTSITRVRFPETLETLNAESFVSCTQLETIDLGPNLKTIKSYAIRSCYIDRITLPEGLTTIEGRAFEGCRDLTNIKIPESVTSIGTFSDKDYLMNPFISCFSLESFSGKYASSDRRSLIVDGLLLSFAPGGMRGATYVVPSNVQHIAQCAFYQAEFGGIALPEGLITIQDDAFGYNNMLKSVTIPSTVETLYYGAFRRCEGLDWIEINRADHMLGLMQSDSHLNSACYNVFFATNNCPIYVPSNLLDQYKTDTNWSTYADRFKSKQPDYAIWYTTTDGAAASYTLPEAYQRYASQIQNIAPNNNNNAPGIGWLKFPINLTEIPELLFEDCANLKTVKIPDGVKYIQGSSFRGCANLENVKFGNKVERIDTWAFADCNLSSVALPNSLTYLGQACFNNNPLTTIHIPESVTSIALNPFSDCGSLASFTGDNPMVADGGRCIIDSRMLISFAPASVTGQYIIPSVVRIIEDGAIRKAQFQAVGIPGAVEKIGGWNFIDCPNLRVVSIVSDNLEIGPCVIRDCPLLDLINMASATPPSIEENTFFYIPSSGSPELGLPESCEISIPGSGVVYYENEESYPYWYALRDHFTYYQATNEIWYHYKNNQLSATLNINAGFGANGLNQSLLLKDRSKISSFAVPMPKSIVPADGILAIAVAAFDGKVTRIPDEVFSSSNFGAGLTLDWISLPNSVNTIGNRAFKGSSSLLSFPVGNNYVLTTIGDEAFMDCSSMANDATGSYAVTIPSSVTTIGERAFKNCSSIQRANATGATSIGNAAFENCSNLLFSRLGNGLTEIADSTFYHCYNLEAVLLPNPGSITTVGEYAFYGDTELKTVGPDNGVAEVYLPGVTELKEAAFFHCIGLERVRMPELLTIEEGVFNMDGIPSTPISFSLPKVQTIQGWYSFGNVIADELYLPSLKDAGSATFIFGYSQIKDIRFGPDLESLPYLNNGYGYCFNNATSSMERNLYFEGSVPPRFGPKTFVTDYNGSGPCYELLNLNSIHVPAGCKEAYKTAFHNANSLYDGFFSIIVDDL